MPLESQRQHLAPVVRVKKMTAVRGGGALVALAHCLLSFAFGVRAEQEVKV